jgi:malate dehydrogenase (oxaloacetate-decarboxylating)
MFLGLSVGGLLSGEDLKVMNKKAIIFALANPKALKLHPEEVPANVAVMATGSSKYPNQINNALAFPGIFRGALEARMPQISEEMCIEAAKAIAALISKDQLDADYIIPTVLEPVSKSDKRSRVALAVASAVTKFAAEKGLARRNVK